MKNLSLTETIAAWQTRKQDLSPGMLALSVQSIRLLAQGQPVSVASFRSSSQLAEREAEAYFDRLKKGGAEFDKNGHLVGNALSLTPSPHRLQINGQTLFAWCALDTLFLPAYLRQSTQVTSTCFTTKTPIRLTVTPDGVETVDPLTTVLSVVIPGVTPSCALKAQTGPHGPVCSSMHFFHSQTAATTWLADNPGIALLSMDEAWQLAYTVWIEPFQKLSLPTANG